MLPGDPSTARMTAGSAGGGSSGLFFPSSYCFLFPPSGYTAVAEASPGVGEGGGGGGAGCLLMTA